MEGGGGREVAGKGVLIASLGPSAPVRGPLLTARDESVRIDAIAAKALMLARGESFAVRVGEGHDEATELEEAVEVAIETQYDHGREMVPNLAHPDDIGTLVVGTNSLAHLIIGAPGLLCGWPRGLPK
jgi:hypothetical protein